MKPELIDKTLANLTNKLGFPWRMGDASNSEDTLALMRERDHEENTATTPPDDEYVDLCCMWAVEFYTPAHMDDLTKSAIKLDNASRTSSPQRTTVAAWLDNIVGSPFAASWLDLGLWQPKGSTPLLVPLDRYMELPEGVAYATGRMSSVSPSIISVTACFVFDNDFAACFDDLLRVDRETYTVPFRGGASYFEPETQKKNDVGMLRTQMSQRAASWFRKNIPGVFSEGLLGGQLPTCEFLTLRKGDPFGPTEQFRNPDERYMSILGVDRDWDAWADTGVSGLRFAVGTGSRNGPRHHAVLAINEQNWPTADMQMYGSEPRRARVNFVSHTIPDFLDCWALWPLMGGYTEQINRVRNSGAGEVGNATNVAKALEIVGSHITNLTDVAAVASDLNEARALRRRPIHYAGQFQPCQPQLYSGSDTLLDMLLKSVSERAQWLSVTNQSVMDQLAQLATVRAATENVRLQKAITRLTRFVVVLTLLSLILVVTQVPTPSWGTPMIEHVGSIFDRVREAIN